MHNSTNFICMIIQLSNRSQHCLSLNRSSCNSSVASWNSLIAYNERSYNLCSHENYRTISLVLIDTHNTIAVLDLLRCTDFNKQSFECRKKNLVAICILNCSLNRWKSFSLVKLFITLRKLFVTIVFLMFLKNLRSWKT